MEVPTITLAKGDEKVVVEPGSTAEEKFRERGFRSPGEPANADSSEGDAESESGDTEANSGSDEKTDDGSGTKGKGGKRK